MKRRKLTLAEAEILIRRDHPGLWEKMTAAEHREALEMLDADRARAAKTVDTDAFIRRQFRKP